MPEVSFLIAASCHEALFLTLYVPLAVYPGLMESIDAKDYNNGLKWAGIIDRCVVKATHSIK